MGEHAILKKERRSRAKSLLWDRISPSCSSNLPGVCTPKPTKSRSFPTDTSTRLTLSSLTRSGGHRPRFFNSRTNSKKGSRKKEGSAFWRRDTDPTSKSVSKGIILTRPDRREGSGTSKHWSDLAL